MVGALEKRTWILSGGQFGDVIGKFPEEGLGPFLIFSIGSHGCANDYTSDGLCMF